MGFFDILLGPSKKQKPPRGKAKPATEKLAREEARYLEHLRRTNPAKWAQIMEARMGISLQGPDAFEQFEEMVKRFKSIGLIKSPKDLANEGDDSIKEMITAALPVVAAIVQAQGQAAAMRAAAQHNPAAQVIPTPPAEDTTPAIAAAPSQPEQESAAKTEGAQPEMSMQARFVKITLERMSPEQAAQWLLGMDHPQLDELVAIVCSTPDDRLPALLTSLGQKAPEFAGVCWWLAGRGQWLVDTAAVLRRLKGSEQVSSAYGL